VAQLYPRALGSRFVASYDTQGYGTDILTRLPVKVNYLAMLKQLLQSIGFSASSLGKNHSLLVCLAAFSLALPSRTM
jgi:hypothetical protein